MFRQNRQRIIFQQRIVEAVNFQIFPRIFSRFFVSFLFFQKKRVHRNRSDSTVHQSIESCSREQAPRVRSLVRCLPVTRLVVPDELHHCKSIDRLVRRPTSFRVPRSRWMFSREVCSKRVEEEGIRTPEKEKKKQGEAERLVMLLKNPTMGRNIFTPMFTTRRASHSPPPPPLPPPSQTTGASSRLKLTRWVAIFSLFPGCSLHTPRHSIHHVFFFPTCDFLAPNGRGFVNRSNPNSNETTTMQPTNQQSHIDLCRTNAPCIS